MMALLIFTNSAFSIEAIKASHAPNIDGAANETIWEKATWHALDQHILGEIPSAKDFSGRFKIAWDSNGVYILAEIVDDVLFDGHADPKEFYWDDDCLEIFIDEDRSGGNHQYNFNAFAYHVALDNQSVDFGPETKDGSSPVLILNEHINSVWKRSEISPNKIIWEVALSVYDDKFHVATNQIKSTPEKLIVGKKMGFMLAYCDNDGSANREHFMGSVEIAPVNGDKNRGYIDASVFGELILVDAK